MATSATPFQGKNPDYGLLTKTFQDLVGPSDPLAAWNLILENIDQGKVINAIKEFRVHTGSDLRTAKEWCYVIRDLPLDVREQITSWLTPNTHVYIMKAEAVPGDYSFEHAGEDVVLTDALTAHDDPTYLPRWTAKFPDGSLRWVGVDEVPTARLNDDQIICGFRWAQHLDVEHEELAAATHEYRDRLLALRKVD